MKRGRRRGEFFLGEEGKRLTIHNRNWEQYIHAEFEHLQIRIPQILHCAAGDSHRAASFFLTTFSFVSFPRMPSCAKLPDLENCWLGPLLSDLKGEAIEYVMTSIL